MAAFQVVLRAILEFLAPAVRNLTTFSTTTSDFWQLANLPLPRNCHGLPM
jgi:hypothetical protein